MNWINYVTDGIFSLTDLISHSSNVSLPNFEHSICNNSGHHFFGYCESVSRAFIMLTRSSDNLRNFAELPSFIGGKSTIFFTCVCIKVFLLSYRVIRLFQAISWFAAVVSKYFIQLAASFDSDSFK